MKTQTLLDQMTLEEQAALLAGADYWTTAALPRLGIPSIKLTDGPNGARGAGGLFNATAAACFPCEISLGASWDVALAARIGAALAREARAKGAQVLLAPTVNLHRSGLSGRNFECFSEDPCLTAELAVAIIEAVQAGGVAATVKHFAANDQEYERQTMSSEVDARTLRELYLVPFEAAVRRARVKAVMTGYNRVNGRYCSESSALIEDVLRGDWDFRGIVMSDWHGMADTVAPLLAGVDLEMPGPSDWRGARLVAAVEEGRVPAETVRRSAGRLLDFIAGLGAFDQAPDHGETAQDRAEDRALIREAGAAGAVLLQNRGDLLPLDPTGLKTLAVIGPNAAVAQAMGGGSAQLKAHRLVSPLEALREALPETRILHAMGATNHRLVQVLEQPFEIDYFHGQALAGPAVFHNSEPSGTIYWYDLPDPGLDPRNFSARLTTRVTVKDSGEHVFGLTSAGFARLYVDGQLLIDGDSLWTRGENFSGTGNSELRASLTLRQGQVCEIRIDYRNPDFIDGIYFRALRLGMELNRGEGLLDEAQHVAAAADAAVVFVGRSGEWDTEGMDLSDMRLPGLQDALVARVLAANPRTVVVLQTGGPVEMPWIDAAPAVLQAWYPGQEVGHAIADVLLGRLAPGGRLPQSFPRAASQMPMLRGQRLHYPGESGRVVYAEGLLTGYRHFDLQEEAPLFPFGHGLSTTQFAWGPLRRSADPAEGALCTLEVTITNTGPRPGAEVVQLYVSPALRSPGTPLKVLRAFGKCHLVPGESASLTLSVTARDLASYDTVAGGFVAAAGLYHLILARDAMREEARLDLTLAQDWREAAG